MCSPIAPKNFARPMEMGAQDPGSPVVMPRRANESFDAGAPGNFPVPTPAAGAPSGDAMIGDDDLGPLERLLRQQMKQLGPYHLASRDMLYY